MFASVCCCQIFGLLGLIFSKLCKSAKAKGERKEAKCYSVTAGVMFACSVISAIIIASIIMSSQ